VLFQVSELCTGVVVWSGSHNRPELSSASCSVRLSGDLAVITRAARVHPHHRTANKPRTRQHTRPHQPPKVKLDGQSAHGISLAFEATFPLGGKPFE
jgi:hypothetical protein